MAKKVGVCAKCKETKTISARGLCSKCYDFVRRNEDISQYATLEKSISVKACSVCGEVKRIAAHDKCKKCYDAWYTAQPHIRDRRKQRDSQPEHIEARRRTDAKRDKTTKRRLYKRRYSREYFQQHPEKRRRKALSRSAESGVECSLTPHHWYRLLAIFNNTCAYCGVSDTKLVQEHWIPLSKDGPYSADNIVPSCASCNSKKHTKTGKEFLSELVNNRSL